MGFNSGFKGLIFGFYKLQNISPPDKELLIFSLFIPAVFEYAMEI